MNHRLVATSLLLSAATLAAASIARSDDTAEVDRWLARLGLYELRITNAENRLAEPKAESPKPKNKGKKTAPLSPANAPDVKSIADLYARWLLDVGADEVAFERARTKAQEFLARHPEARTPELDLLIQQAEFQRAESQFLALIDRRASAAERAAMETAFDRLAKSFVERSEQAEKEIEQDLASATAFEPKRGGKSDAAEEAVKKKQVLQARAQFFAGWSHYYKAMTFAKEADRSESLGVARTWFCRLLDLSPDDSPVTIETEESGFGSPWKARALLGLALCNWSRASPTVEQVAEGRMALAALVDVNTAPTVRDQAAFWRVQALWNAGLDDQARKIADETLEDSRKKLVPGTAAMCVALVRRGQAEAKKPGEITPTAMTGLKGLIQLKQFDVAAAAIAKHKLDARGSDDFFLLCLYGKQSLADAEKSKDAATYETAREVLTRAMAMPEATTNADLAASARSTLAWAHYRLGKPADAVPHFQQAARGLRRASDPKAVESAWMAVVCLQQLVQKKGPGAEAELRRALDDVRRDYPGTAQAKRAEYILAKTGGATRPAAETLSELEAVRPDSPNYLDARWEIVALRHRQWKEAAEGEKPAAAKTLRETADKFRDLAGDRVPERRLRAGLMAIETVESDAGAVDERLSRLIDDATKVDDRSDAVVEWRYRKLQQAQRRGDANAASDEAERIVAAGRGTAYETPALVIVAIERDKRLAAEPTPENRARAIEAYKRLLERLGDDAGTWKAKKNALVASTKLAQHQFDAGDFADAAKRYALLVEISPKDAGLIRMAAISSLRSGDPAAALPHFQRLLSFHSSDSEAWMEAKHGQLDCLRRTDPAGAKAALKQFRLLYPDIKFEAWKAKMATLSTAIDSL